ncbi:MAG: hypothetical protein IJO79_01985 [Firmicutes bacterium]|nr:hypothetical protein [Clostridiales bacterium]MBQ9931099.1 hypothetical protein [Bacillota bacterium]
MTKVTINPGICGLTAKVTAQADDEDQVVLTIESACTGVGKIIENLGDTFDPFEICLTKPGQNPLYEFAAKAFPGHAGCPVIAGIVKCVEAECGLALKKDVSIVFED